jgi:hypothetical protein
MGMKNLVNLFHQTDRTGLNWYVDANKFCREVSEKHGIPLPNVCAIVSALSPGVEWSRNKQEALQLIRGKRSGFTTYGQNVIKAIKALTHPNPIELFSPKTGAKTYNFFMAILQPERSDTVVIDRHAFRVATGKDYVGGLKPGQYRIIADHYIKAARKLGILPNQLQAVLWVWYRNNNSRTNRPF